jgi:hypothetical protein
MYPIVSPAPLCGCPAVARYTPLPLLETITFPIAAAAATITATPISNIDAMLIEMSSDPFGPTFTQPISFTRAHKTAGLVLSYDSDHHRCRLDDMAKGTLAHKTPYWRSRLRNTYLIMIGTVPVHTIHDVEQAFADLFAQACTSITLTFATNDTAPALNHAGLPQLYADQLAVIKRHIHAISQHKVNSVNANEKLTRRKLLKRDDWPEWEAAEFAQLDSYHSQQMFGRPVLPPPSAALFYWVWVYIIKTHENNRKKARAVCDGSTRGQASVVHGYTYAPTPDMMDFRLQVALAAIWNLQLFSADVHNAFAEANRPKQQYFMKIDDQFRNWWASRFPDKDLPPGAVIPILRNLQGHPEAPRMWSLHIDEILKTHFHLKPTTHAPCLYIGQFVNSTMIILRQVDDFSIACNSAEIYISFCDAIDKHLSMPISRLGLMAHFNGLDVVQQSDCITLHVGQYLDQVFKSHGWASLHAKIVPMRPDNSYIKSLDKAIPFEPEERKRYETQHFRYRAAIGELIWPMITVRPDLAFPVVKLSQFSVEPAEEHFQAVMYIFQYLFDKRQLGITYTRTMPINSLPGNTSLPRLVDPNDFTNDLYVPQQHSQLMAFSDSDWAMDTRHRRSISGAVVMLAGGAVAWKCRVQPAPALSTTEAEFMAGTDTGRLVLYLRSLLADLDYPCIGPTPLHEDNRASIMMAQAQAPTRHTRHIDIRHFAMLSWVELGEIEVLYLDTNKNPADIMTKQTPRLIFFRHLDFITGRVSLFHATRNSVFLLFASNPPSAGLQSWVGDSTSVLQSVGRAPGAVRRDVDNGHTTKDTRLSNLL